MHGRGPVVIRVFTHGTNHEVSRMLNPRDRSRVISARTTVQEIRSMDAAQGPLSLWTRLFRPRFVIILAATVFVIGTTACGVTAWYFSGKILVPTTDTPSYSLRLLSLHGNTLSVRRTAGTMRPGFYSLQWHGGRVEVGTVTSVSPSVVFRQIVGSSHGLTMGTPLHLDIYMHSSPDDMHIRYRTVQVTGPLGRMPAWYIPGRRSTWVLFVHGRGANRAEGLRPLSTLTQLGLPVLDLSYRNDVGTPRSPDGLYHLGATEWKDVQAGVRFAAAHGARGVILYGYSMGGSIVEAYLHRSPESARVEAVVLDAPALDWSAVLDFQGKRNNLPGIVTALTKRIITWRLGVANLQNIDEVTTASDFRVPTLLFQGTDDTFVPSSSNAALARGRPGPVTYVQVQGAEHTQEWNANPSLYASRLRAFLCSLHALARPTTCRA